MHNYVLDLDCFTTSELLSEAQAIEGSLTCHPEMLHRKVR
jgi:hypothetical protein